MSIEIIKKQLKQFLKTATPEVMAIKGSWGVGKTFAWNKYLEDANRNNGICLEKYSYISLFGVNSLDELKLSMFMGVVPKQHIGTTQEPDIVKSTDKVLSSLSRKAVGVLRELPYAKNIWPTIESLSFYSLSKTIVCIDDFERKGKALDAQDIMGLATFLKEQKQCKVVLILNDESLENAALIDYKKYREKVIDIELAFNPSAQECADIALSDDIWSSRLRTYIVDLRMNNIRTIKRIERLASLICSRLDGYEEEVINQALHSLTLFACCFYNKATGFPRFEHLKSFENHLFDSEDDKNKETEEEKRWKAMLTHYGYYNTDEFDLEIAATVEHGYVDDDSFICEAQKKNQEFISSKSVESHSSIWRRSYHNTFEDNGPELIDDLYNSLKVNAKYISPVNLDGTVKLFRGLGENKLADEIIDIYIMERKDEKGIFSLREHPFRSDIKDKKLIEKFNDINESQKETMTIKDVLAKISDRDGWGQKDEKTLASASPDEYYELFKCEKGPHLSSYVDTCLKFGRFENASEQQKKIAKNATIALKKIGSESALNAMRVATYGIKLQTVEGESDT